MSEPTPQAEENSDSRWPLLVAVGLLVALVVVVLFAAGVFDGDEEVEPALTPEPTAESAQPEAAGQLTILQPVPGDVVPADGGVDVAGTAMNLPDDTLTVRAVDAEGNVLAEQDVELGPLEEDQGGSWSVTLAVAIEGGTAGDIRAVAATATGEVVVEDAVNVTFGELSTVEPQLAIESPADDLTLVTEEAVTVSGSAAGLPDDTVVVLAVSEDGSVVGRATTVLSGAADEAGLVPWSVSLLIDAPQGTEGTIEAFGVRSADQSRVALVSVPVNFGAPDPFVTIEEPQPDSVLETGQPLTVSGRGGALFEGNVVVEARAADGTVLAQTATTIEAPDAGTGGSGPWTARLELSLDQEKAGQLVAFSTSPRDGSVVAEDSIEVTFAPAAVAESAPANDSPLVGPSWLLQTMEGDPILDGQPLTANFGADGRLTGQAGCNNYFADYSVPADGDTLAVAAPGATRMLCAEPEGLMAQETAFLTLLESAVSYQIEDGQLVLQDEVGQPLLTFSAAVSGLVTVPAEETIPAEGQLLVQLIERISPSAPVRLLSEQRIDLAGQDLPIPFALAYDPADIDDVNIYQLSAQINDANGVPMFTLDQLVPVFETDQPAEGIELIVRPVG